MDRTPRFNHAALPLQMDTQEWKNHDVQVCGCRQWMSSNRRTISNTSRSWIICDAVPLPKDFVQPCGNNAPVLLGDRGVPLHPIDISSLLNPVRRAAPPHPVPIMTSHDAGPETATPRCVLQDPGSGFRPDQCVDEQKPVRILASVEVPG